MIRIGDFSKLSRLSIKTLRFYKEEKSLAFKKRGSLFLWRCGTRTHNLYHPFHGGSEKEKKLHILMRLVGAKPKSTVGRNPQRISVVNCCLIPSKFYFTNKLGYQSLGCENFAVLVGCFDLFPPCGKDQAKCFRCDLWNLDGALCFKPCNTDGLFISILLELFQSDRNFFDLSCLLRKS